MTKKHISSDIVIYQAPNGAIELKGDLRKETIWANLDQISTLFGRDKSVISKHIKNILRDEELSQDQVVAFFATTAKDGKTYQVEYFNLDMIISIGYRVNSSIATKFRQRATKTLKQHIADGYTINKKVVQKNYDLFLQAVENVKKLASHKDIPSDDILELIKSFGSTWFSLDAFDKDTFGIKKQTQKKVRLQAERLQAAISQLKNELIAKGEATDFFAQEKKQGNLEGILGNILQSAFGKDVYPSIESKAAHLLYFVVKNHPFTDGNKRSGAFSFVWFLQQVGYDFRSRITPEALTAITLLIATSNPKEKDRVVDLVMLLLAGS